MLNTKNISDVKEELNFGLGNQNISTINNLTSSSKIPQFWYGEYVDDDTLYNYNNLDVDETDNTYFNNDEILKPYQIKG